MKSRSLKRFLATLLVVAMIGCDFTAYAQASTVSEEELAEIIDALEEIADEETEEDANKENENNAGTSVETNKGDSEEDSNKEAYVNERLYNNYTLVSKKYKAGKYKGDTIVYKVLESFSGAVDKNGKNIENVITTEVEGYTNADKVVKLGMGDVATFKIYVEKAGVYVFGFDQIAYDPDSILSVEMKLTLNGKVPFYEANRVVFSSDWKLTDKDYDRYNNEIVSIPDKVLEWKKAYIMDTSYRYMTPLMFELKEGENVITMEITEGSVKIGDLYLEAEKIVPAYSGSHKAEGDFFQVIQAERPNYRNDSSIRATCEYDCDLDPYNSRKKVLNILDSGSFADSGMKLTYDLEVPADGYYYMAFNYRQTDKIDFPVFMNILVDGEIPHKELESYEFYYTRDFIKKTLTDSNKKKMGIYLTKGKHQISIELTNDKLRNALETFDRIMGEINDTSLDITKVTGTGQDKYRDIVITDYIPDINQRLARWIKDLKAAYKDLAQYSKTDNCGTIASLETAIERLQSLAKKPNKIPYRLDELSTGTSSVNQDLANVINELNGNNISLDSIYIYQEGSADQIPGTTNIFVKIWESIKRFFASFNDQDYSVSNISETSLQVWIARPRQYLEIIQKLVDKYFTPKTGIKVDLAIMPDAGKLILSNAAGEAPDVAQAIDYTQPFELAVRNAIVDMTKFDDYAEVMSRFPEGMLIPSVIDGGIYSMPETFYFWVQYYRTDIIEKLNIKVPNTIEDIQHIVPELKNRGLEFFYPTAGTTGQRSFAQMTPILYQNGVSLYNATYKYADKTQPYYLTAIDSEKAITAFETLTELFTIYDIPQDTSFYQHFRMGDIPIGIADYFMYNTLINAAPEIENSWAISLVPGVPEVDENGNPVLDENGNQVINRMTAGAAQNSVIMKSDRTEKIVLTDGSTMERDEAAWEYLKWWMSKEVQVEFGVTLQTTYGKEFIWNTANIEAFKELPWKSRDKAIIVEQMHNIVETPRIPGTYMLERELSNAYIEVVIDGGTLRTAIDTAVKRINRETVRKLKEFGYLDEDGNIIKEYEIPSIETVREILAKGKKK